MELIIENKDNKVLAHVKGRLDTVSASEFEKKMESLMAEDILDIELDCSELSYIASSGLRHFLSLQKSVTARGGKLVLSGLQPGIKAVFDMTRFSSIFTIV